MKIQAFIHKTSLCLCIFTVLGTITLTSCGSSEKVQQIPYNKTTNKVVSQLAQRNSASSIPVTVEDAKSCKIDCEVIYGTSSNECVQSCLEEVKKFKQSEQEFLQLLTPEQRTEYFIDVNRGEQRNHERLMRELEMRRNRIDRMYN